MNVSSIKNSKPLEEVKISSAKNGHEFEDLPNTSSSAAGQSSSLSSVVNPGRDNRPLCRYFASNICYKGDSCLFSHNRNAKPDNVCKFYLAGNCSYGQGCRYDHIRPRILTNDEPPQSSMISAPSAQSSASAYAQQSKKAQNPQQKSSKFSTLPSLDANSLQQKKPAEKSSSSSNVVSVSPPTSNAWDKPLQMSNAFSMSAIGSELEQIDYNDYANYNEYGNENESYFPQLPPEDIPLCPYFETGNCINGDMCIFIHGDLCDMCGANVLHPYNKELAKQHHRECLAEHEKAMEEAFAEARSVSKQCGICMEMIIDKKLRFGILQNCKHCYCLNCIREWRKRSEEFEAKTVRSCPECRVHSDFVIPSESWVEEQEEKDKFIKLYLENMKQKQCKYMKSGEVDDCPFGNKCFYKHQLPDGTLAVGDSPRALRKQRRHVRDLHLQFLDDSDDDAILNEVIESLMAARGSTSARGSSNGRSRHSRAN